MRSPGFCAAFLLLKSLFAWRDSSSWARGRFVLAFRLPQFSELAARAMQVSWLGPGLLMAVFLIVTLRGARRIARKPLHRVVHSPKLERYRGVVPRRHQDLEV